MSGRSERAPFRIRLTFFGDLRLFLPRLARGTLARELKAPASVKDVIEAGGVPHTEVGRVLVNGQDAIFSHVINENAAIDVYPVDVAKTAGNGMRLQKRTATKFVVDGHLGKLARDLRLLGFDVFYQNTAQDRHLLEVMQREGRALITRDRRLLMHAIVQEGYCPRSHHHEEQTIEVVKRFDLTSALAPFTRCLACNTRLETIEKKEVVERLEPLTKIYYEKFRRCPGCGKIYWGGSHFDKLRARVERVRAKLGCS